MPAHIYNSSPLPPPSVATQFSRADIVINGLNQAGPSFEARVFVNNPDADETTALTPENGYVGSIHVYGGAGMVDPVTGQAEPLPMTRYVEATDIVRQAAEQQTDLTVTVVATTYSDEVTPQQAGLSLDLDDIVIKTAPEE